MRDMNPFYDCSTTGLKPLWRARLLKSCTPQGRWQQHHARKSVGFKPSGVHSLSTVETCNGHPVTFRPARANTDSGFETGCLKNGAKLLLPNFRARCSSPRASGNGFGWLPVCLLNSKAPSRAYSGDVQAQRSPSGFRCCNPPQPFQLSSKPEGQHSSNTP